MEGREPAVLGSALVSCYGFGFHSGSCSCSCSYFYSYSGFDSDCGHLMHRYHPTLGMAQPMKLSRKL